MKTRDSNKGVVAWPLLIIILIVTAVVSQNWITTFQYQENESTAAIKDTSKSPEISTDPAPSPVLAGQIKKGESFYDLMKDSGTSDANILEISIASRGVYDLKRTRPGHAYRIQLGSDGQPQGFHYEINQENRLELEKIKTQWTAKKIPITFIILEQVVQGVIKDSLYLSLVEACEDTALAVELSDIYAWDIDFSLDLRKGDRFGIIYETKWHDGQFKGAGRILAARFINQGTIYDAVYYKDEKGNHDYYDAMGESLQKEFLKSPLRFKYISSYFSKNRLHPILKIRRPHLGVDYAAPRGTPVRAAADGRVTFVGRKGGMGKMIKIFHSSIYRTAYGHLSRYARGIKRNRWVKQGDIIGYVGSTGISTGPHLHYSFYQRGKLINPLRIKNPRAKGVPKGEIERFKTLAFRLLQRIDPPAYEDIATALDGGNR